MLNRMHANNVTDKKDDPVLYIQKSRVTVSTARLWNLALVFMCWTVCHAQLPVDPDYEPSVAVPLYPEHDGPTVLVDSAHDNGHTIGGDYRPFGDLLAADGYDVQDSPLPFSHEDFPTRLREAEIFVISNARHLTAEEIDILTTWVHDGGSLFFIFDHTLNQDVIDLGAALGIDIIPSRLSNFVAVFGPRPAELSCPASLPCIDAGTLQTHYLTEGREPDERVQVVLTFVGSAFRAPDAVPLLTFGPEALFVDGTPATGLLQGAVMEVGKGRVYVSGEAAMFTAQLSGDTSFGLTTPGDNEQYLLNIMHWLDGLPGECEPQIAGSVEIANSVGGRVWDVVVVGSTAFVASTNALTTVEVTDPENPRILGSMDMSGFGADLAISAGVAYLANSDGLQVIDVEDLSNPRIVASLETFDGVVAVQGDLAYVVNSAGFHVINVENPTMPEELGLVDTPGFARDVEVSGNFAYVAADDETDFLGGLLLIVDAGNPAMPRIVGSVDTLECPQDVEVSGDVAYVAEHEGDLCGGGFVVIDVGDPAKPEVLAGLGSIGEGSVSVWGHLAYLLEYSGLRLVCVEDPARPRTVKHVDTPGLDVAVSVGIALVVDRASRLQVIDVSSCQADDARFLRGDCNDDGGVDISDAVSTLGSLFLGDGDPGCDDACDSNDDGAVDISDAITTLGVLFLGSGSIPLPGMRECGVDPTEDEVACERPMGCS